MGFVARMYPCSQLHLCEVWQTGIVHELAACNRMLMNSCANVSFGLAQPQLPYEWLY